MTARYENDILKKDRKDAVRKINIYEMNILEIIPEILLKTTSAITVISVACLLEIVSAI